MGLGIWHHSNISHYYHLFLCRYSAVNMDVEDYEIDILSPIRGTYQNSNLFYFPKSYKRLEKIVRMYPANKFDCVQARSAVFTSKI
jgi:hypothetical protein